MLQQPATNCCVPDFSLLHIRRYEKDLKDEEKLPQQKEGAQEFLDMGRAIFPDKPGILLIHAAWVVFTMKNRVSGSFITLGSQLLHNVPHPWLQIQCPRHNRRLPHRETGLVFLDVPDFLFLGCSQAKKYGIQPQPRWPQ